MSTQAPPMKKEKPNWVNVVKTYQVPSAKSIWQIVNSFGGFFGTMAVMFLTYGSIPYVFTLLMAIPAAGFLMRIFIIQHDCGHGSFFRSKRANAVLGNICGVLTMTPYEWWRTSHAIHHAHNGDLDHRGTGDVYTMTFAEYEAASPRRRLMYRIYRHPFMMFVVGPLLMFLILHRSPFVLRHARSKAGRNSIIRTDIGIIVMLTALTLLVGVEAMLAVWLPAMILTASVGVWMFYVQHQFEDAYWSQKPEWDYAAAALEGSSYYKLPKVLQWFSGNIGLHHIHHLSPRIPNYELQRCHDENPEFQDVVTLTLADSIKLGFSNLALWDEEAQKLINFRTAHHKLREGGQDQTAAQEAPANA